MLICYIPFKVICIIGANKNVFPRKIKESQFNLLYKKIHLGDKNTRDQDCYLFLQNLICAKKYFYISYINYSDKNKTKMYPSIFIDQLQDYIKSNFFYKKENTYNKKSNINKNDKILNEYLFKKCKKYNTNLNSIINKKSSNIDIHYKDLIKFWIHPIKYFCHLKFNINIPKKNESIIITEPFSTNKLHAFNIKNIILTKLIEKKNDDKIFQTYKTSGILPYGPFGEIFWSKQKTEMNHIANLVAKNRIQTTQKKIELKIKKYYLYGLLTEIQQDGLLRWKSNTINYSDRMSLWLEHLIYCAIGGTGGSKIIGYKKDTWSFNPIKQDIAYQHLTNYLSGFFTGMKKPLFLLKSGFSWLDSVYDIKKNNITNNNIKKKIGYTKLLNTWTGNLFSTGEKNDMYVKKILVELNKHNTRKICKTAKIWFLPILQNKKRT